MDVGAGRAVAGSRAVFLDGKVLEARSRSMKTQRY